ncbi:MAG: 50S ribosomal protein L35 [Planctomycetes bacterium]|nr:50S ribosomal protein L35 [Planctomycetota bacterium]
MKKKTHKGLTKRVKVTGSGKVKSHPSMAGHLLSGKRPKRRRRLRGWKLVEGAKALEMKKLLQV